MLLNTGVLRKFRLSILIKQVITSMRLVQFSRVPCLALGVFFLLSGLVSGIAAVRIGNEAAVTVPTSAHYSTAMNVRPGNKETVSNNPPIFTWFYNTNHLCGGEQNPNGFTYSVFTQTNAFQFQIATQANFGGTLALDINTPFNYYNFLAPLDTNATRQFWWRVKYVTNGVAWWTNGIYTFTVANGASPWDRSMLADTNYYATNSAHPIFGFRAGQEAAIWSYAQTDDTRAFSDLMTAATRATNAAYWKNVAEWPVNTTRHPKYATPAADGYGRANDIGAVLFLWRFSGDNRWTNASMTGWLLTNLSHQVNWFVSPSNNYAMQDYGDNESVLPLRLIIATYDWLYDYLGSDPATFNGRLRTNALHGLRLVSRFWIYNDLWSASPAPTGGLKLYYDWNYANRPNYCVEAGSFSKQGNSHQGVDLFVAMPVAWVAGQDDPEIRLHRDWMLNAMLARTSSFGGWAANHIGVYGYVDFHISSLVSGLMFLDFAFPQAQIRRTEFCTRFPEWYTRHIPYQKRSYHGPYGDGQPTGMWGHFFGGKTRGWDLAAFTQSGVARQHYDINRGYSNSYWAASSHFDQFPVRYQYRTLPAPQTNTTSALYVEDGYVAASSKSPSEFDCFTNGVGFSFKAPPRGNYQNHQIPDALTFDLWAYGTQITDAGGGNLDSYGYHSESSPGLFINGYGQSGGLQAPYAYSQRVPVESSIIGFTNSGTNFVYCAADGTALFTNSFHPLKGNVTKVRRHILFPRSKYWVIYDEFGTRSNATFAFRWHIPWAFRYSAGSALPNETVFTGNRIGSNSLAMTPNGFTYVAGNYADDSYPNPPRIPVHVQFANAPNTYGVFNAVGVNSLGVGTANARGTSATNSTFNPFLNRTYSTVNPDRAVGMWVTNRVAATNWHFMTVIVPQQKGVAAPIIERLDDTTVAVTYDGVTETNTFGTNYTGAFTYRVEYTGPRPILNVQVPQGVRVAPPGQ
jgi:hypothetical protein